MDVITEMYAFVAKDEDGEGVIGMKTEDGWMPLVGADMARVASLIPHALAVAKASGKEVVLKKFELVETVPVTE